MQVAMPLQFHLTDSSFDYSTQTEFAFERLIFGFEEMGSCFLLVLLSLLLIISTLLLLSPPARSDSAPANVSHHDQQALLGLKRGITFDPNNSLANWTPSLPFCNWTEYGLAENVSIKGDVYSYGVLLLEMVTKKRPTDAMFVEGLNLQKWVSSYFPNMLQDVVDSRLLSNVNMEQHRCLVSFIHIGLFCTNESPQERPTMRDVRRALESLRDDFMGNVANTLYLTRTISNLISNHNAAAKVEGMFESQSSTY